MADPNATQGPTDTRCPDGDGNRHWYVTHCGDAPIHIERCGLCGHINWASIRRQLARLDRPPLRRLDPPPVTVADLADWDQRPDLIGETIRELAARHDQQLGQFVPNPLPGAYHTAPYMVVLPDDGTGHRCAGTITNPTIEDRSWDPDGKNWHIAAVTTITLAPTTVCGLSTRGGTLRRHDQPLPGLLCRLCWLDPLPPTPPA